MARKKVQVVTNALPDHLRWSVLWVVPGKKTYRVVRKECENDLAEAIRIYTKVVEAGKKFPTLRCNNAGFPPPERFQPYVAKVKDKRWIKGKRQRGITKYKFVTRIPLKKLNNKGIYWCPYCREMRRFRQQTGFVYEGIYVGSPGIYCPICGTSYRDFYVRRWNPICHRIWANETSTRSRRGSRNRGKARN